MSTIEHEVADRIEVEVEEEVFGLETTGTLMTPEEFDEHEEWDELYVYELIHGVLVVSPSPSAAERGPNEDLWYLLIFYRENHPLGSAMSATLPEHTLRTGSSRRRADRAIWAGLGHRPDTRREFPTIVVEFVSRGKRDRHRDYVEKRREYLDHGAQEYWLFDRFERKLTVFRGDEEIVIAHAGVYQSPLLPGFELPVARILAAADRYKD